MLLWQRKHTLRQICLLRNVSQEKQKVTSKQNRYVTNSIRAMYRLKSKGKVILERRGKNKGGRERGNLVEGFRKQKQPTRAAAQSNKSLR